MTILTPEYPPAGALSASGGRLRLPVSGMERTEAICFRFCSRTTDTDVTLWEGERPAACFPLSLLCLAAPAGEWRFCQWHYIEEAYPPCSGERAQSAPDWSRVDALTLDAADRAAPFEIRDVQLMGAEALARRYRTLRVFDEPAALASCCGWFGRPEEMLTRYLRAYAESFFARHDRLLKDRGLDQTQSPEEAVRLLSDLRGRYRAILQRNLGLDALRALVDCDIDYSSESRNGRFNWYSVGCIDRREDGYVVEKKLLRLYDQVYTPLLFFRAPEQGERRPTILHLYGHGESTYADAQLFGVRMARRGYNVCITEPAGQNERSVCSRGNDYHGGFPGAVTNLVGVAEMALQMLDAMQVLSYLCARPDVDVSRIGATGGSGGGQQSMLLLALDDRVAAAGLSSTPYIAAREYFLAHFCTGEAVPGWIAEMDENLLLAAQAPRPVIRFYAEKDDGAPSLERMLSRHAPVLEAYRRAGCEGGFCVAVHSSYHGYPQQARDIACGFFDRVFLGVGDGSPVPEEGMPASLPDACDYRVYPNDIYHIEITPLDALRRNLLTRGYERRVRQEPAEQKKTLRALLHHPRPGGTSAPRLLFAGSEETFQAYSLRRMVLETEPGVAVPFFLLNPGGKKLVAGLGAMGKNSLLGDPLTDAFLHADCAVLLPDLRGVGETFWPMQPLTAPSGAEIIIGESGDYLALQDSELHNTALLLGSSALGMWLHDLDGLIRFAAEELGFHTLSVWGRGAFGLAALLAGILNDRVGGVLCDCAPASFFHSCAAGVFGFRSQMDPYTMLAEYLEPHSTGKELIFRLRGEKEEKFPYLYGRSRMAGALLPQLLSRVGDIPDLAALAAPKRLLFRRPMDLDGRYLDWSRAANLFVHAQRAYRAAGAEDRIRLCHFLNAYSLPLTARECVGEFIREDSI